MANPHFEISEGKLIEARGAPRRFEVGVTVPRLVAAVLSVIACAIVVNARGSTTPVDAGLPLLAFLVSVFSWLAARRAVLGSCIDSVVPLFILTAAGVGETTLRLALYGLGFAIAAFLAVVATYDGHWSLGRASVVTAAAVLGLRLIPWNRSMLPRDLVVVGGVLLLLFAFSERAAGSSRLVVSLAQLLLAVTLGVITSAEPMRAALAPALVAAAIFLVKSPTLFSIAGAVVAGLLAGKWGLVLVAIPLGAKAVQEVRAGAHALAIPPLAVRSANIALAVRFGLFSPGLVTRTRLDASSVVAILYASAGMVLRPMLGTTMLLAAAAVMAIRATPSALLSATVVFVGSFLTLLPWSGVLAPTFPLPLSTLQCALIAFAAVSAAVGKRSRYLAILGSFASLAFLLAGLQLADRDATETHPIEVSLSPGESIDIHDGPQLPEVALVMSGANIAQLVEGTALGEIRILTRGGGAFRETISVGDIADWGAFRRQNRFRTENPFPHYWAGRVRGYGTDAYAEGQGRVRLQTHEDMILLRVTADRGLPTDSRLQIHRLEWRRAP